jgi:hypothetical protein
MGFLGLEKPNTNRIMKPIGCQTGSLELRTMQSLAVTAVAKIFMSTSLFLGLGFAVSLT